MWRSNLKHQSEEKKMNILYFTTSGKVMKPNSAYSTAHQDNINFLNSDVGRPLRDSLIPSAERILDECVSSFEAGGKAYINSGHAAEEMCEEANLDQTSHNRSLAGSVLKLVIEQNQRELTIIASKGKDDQKYYHYFIPKQGLDPTIVS